MIKFFNHTKYNIFKTLMSNRSNHISDMSINHSIRKNQFVNNKSKIDRIEQHLRDVEEANKVAHALYRRRLLLDQIETIDQDKKRQ